jgi:hypothetical protein
VVLDLVPAVRERPLMAQTARSHWQRTQLI